MKGSSPQATSSEKKSKTNNKTKKKSAKKPKLSYIVKPEKMSLTEWQIALRRQVAKEEHFAFASVDEENIPGEYTATNPVSRQVYKVVYRGANSPWNYCSCMDFRTSRLGTCKHIEGLKTWLSNSKNRHVRRELPPYTSVYLDYSGVRTVRIRIGTEHNDEFRALAAQYFDSDGVMPVQSYSRFGEFLSRALRIDNTFRFYQDAIDFIVERRETDIRRQLVEHYTDQELDQLLTTRLYPYQKEGARFAFVMGRAVIADEMGLGKTIQAIATAEMLRRENLVEHVLILCPTSLKYQWKREIERFAKASAHVIEGNHLSRKNQYDADIPYKIVSYNSACNDIKILGSLQTDLLIMDEVQRLKNWNTQISIAARRIRSKYSVILSGTPLENKLEELYSVMEFVDQYCLAPYYQFKADYIETDFNGKVTGYHHLNKIGERIKNRLIRRTKKQVAIQMPGRQDKNLLVPMTHEQVVIHGEFAFQVSLIVQRWCRLHFLSESDKLRLLKLLSQMRMVCDSTYILDQKSRHDTKVEETMSILSDLFENEPDEKVVIFSQWERMTRLIAHELDKKGIGYANLHGAIPSKKRQDLIARFLDDSECRVFLSTDAGSTGLNLQVAATIINLDLPWNPAVLEQRIARIYRLGQQRNIQVINLVSHESFEEQMLDKLRFKAAMFEGVLDNGQDTIFVGDKDKFAQMMDNLNDMMRPTEKSAMSAGYNAGLTANEQNKETDVEASIAPKDDSEQAEEPVQVAALSRDLPSDENTSSSATSSVATTTTLDPFTSSTMRSPSVSHKSSSTIPSPSGESRSVTEPADLLSQGMSFLSGLAQTLQSPEKTERLVETLVETDENTGETTLRIPVASKQSVRDVLGLLNRLFSQGTN